MPEEEDIYNENQDMLDDEHDEENDHSDMDVDDDNNQHENMDINDNDNDNENENEDNADDGDENGDEEEDEEGDGDGDDRDGEGDDDGDDGDDEDENTVHGKDQRQSQDPSQNNQNQEKDQNNPDTQSKSQNQNQSQQNGTTGENGTDNNHSDKLTQGSDDSSKNKEPAMPKIDSFEIRSKALEAVKTASEFDIVPIVAVPYAQQCHSIALSDGPKWLLTGGEDGFIRKYDFAASIDGKAPLTVAQKHNLMDNINKAGVIGSYWENEQPMTKSQIINENPKFRESDFTTGFASYEPKINPVYSLDVERNGLWCLSGLLSGGISLYTMIYNEGAIHHYFHHNTRKNAEPTLDSGHLDAVSVLRLNNEQNTFLSGLWDKTIREWDLNTGKTKHIFKGSTGQISSIQYRPIGLTDLTFDDANSDVDSLFGSDQEEDENADTSDANISKSSIRTDSSKNKTVTDDQIFMSSSIDGAINIWDARVSGSSPVLRLGVPDGTPPWCMTASWSNDGDKIYAGRRNSTVEEFSLRMPHERRAGNIALPNVLKRLSFPKISGPVSSLSVMPNDNFIFCGSNDNIRLYNLNLYDEFTQDTVTAKKRATPFYVIPGHHGGVLSNLIVDETGRFMISTSGNRGWGHSSYADVVLIYSIDTEAPQQ